MRVATHSKKAAAGRKSNPEQPRVAPEPVHVNAALSAKLKKAIPRGAMEGPQTSLKFDKDKGYTNPRSKNLMQLVHLKSREMLYVDAKAGKFYSETRARNAGTAVGPFNLPRGAAKQIAAATASEARRYAAQNNLDSEPAMESHFSRAEARQRRRDIGGETYNVPFGSDAARLRESLGGNRPNFDGSAY